MISGVKLNTGDGDGAVDIGEEFADRARGQADEQEVVGVGGLRRRRVKKGASRK